MTFKETLKITLPGAIPSFIVSFILNYKILPFPDDIQMNYLNNGMSLTISCFMGVLIGVLTNELKLRKQYNQNKYLAAINVVGFSLLTAALSFALFRLFLYSNIQFPVDTFINGLNNGISGAIGGSIFALIGMISYGFYRNKHLVK
ncbi:hypothetical protein L0B53_12670 [Vibrio sp. SS-MA-C1-2]|uniref:hypothetical protein n=1 Tax=Vibrio sp. SS-MA-C1-2 TaxID=2908646 RepID=UPI001F19F73A|nr:hypothetical protein [Vibrio sp. SS-MA-C1-2]UJF17877.1 hypothetical protein L0B53_12670 [Vibrio sp. SS-MA-C1-2]